MNEEDLNKKGCNSGDEVEEACDERVHDCGCGCSDCGEHESLVVDLEDENGNIVPCEVVDGFEFKENEYAIVQNPQNGAVYLFKVEGEGPAGELVIPEEEEFKEVSAYYQQLSQE
ncbi:DUF1292 domain-containing protein [Clostridium sp. HV4-5-A1G]|mgnify:FL=1|jgi:hypothetical protein|uniref:DUF1292 domain-containing protein n=1 Tax=Clostridium sp. HV4-5-A1G TaxID=2004595 RepID=UPI00123AE600|nr:DUF1292 domain-containing protein [Clostridium sp. HV4-5-A1G]KAA8678149.1 DUF1292 domain-containing protein [Clostridium sp. HV4-5-A1G]CAB1241482.1 conserved hypothetical protein [Clostridiaceae bacterium BL-3]